jgi:hypothetical protein
MWTIRRPCASICAAAAITSMTINGGTLLRLEGINSCFAASSMVNGPSGHATRPAVAAFKRLVWAHLAHALFMTQS